MNNGCSYNVCSNSACSKKRDRRFPDENSPPSDLMQYVNEPLRGIQKEIKYSNVSNIIKCT